MIGIHVGSGATWLLVSLVVAWRRRARFWLLSMQIAASLTTLLAGILLWHRLHSGGMGPVEHWLVVGSFCAFVALGLQLGIAGALARGPLASGGRWLSWSSVAFLTLAAAAMLASRVA